MPGAQWIPSISHTGDVDPDSAGWDTSLRGEAGLRGFVALRSSAALMDTFNAQAQKLSKVIEVAKIRALEAQREVHELEEMARLGSAAVPGQIAGGVGFGNSEDGDDAGGGGEDLLGGLAGGLGGLAGGKRGKRGKGKAGKSGRLGGMAGGLAGGVAGGLAAGGEDASTFDMDGWDIHTGLENEVSLTRTCVTGAATLSKDAAHANKVSNFAWRAAVEAMRYPGEPPEALAPAVQKRKVARPRDLAPAWMDFLYASTPGSDPYRLPAGTARNPFATREVHNPFGSPPLPAGWTPAALQVKGKAGGISGMAGGSAGAADKFGSAAKLAGIAAF